MQPSLDELGMKPEFNFINSLNVDDQDNVDYRFMQNQCKYHNVNEFRNIFQNTTGKFSIYSLNIRSLNYKMDEFLDFMGKINSDKASLSMIAIQELWTVPLPGFAFPDQTKIQI